MCLNGKRGLMQPVKWTNRYGALIRGDVFAPLPGAHDPYTGKALEPPYPNVVITTSFWDGRPFSDQDRLPLGPGLGPSAASAGGV